MESGTQEYHLPGDIPVDVDYVIEGGRPIFDEARIGGIAIDASRVFVSWAPHKIPKNSKIGMEYIQSVGAYFQEMLDEDAAEIIEGHRIAREETRHDIRNDK